MNKFEKVVTGVLTLVELGGIMALTGIALKRNQDAYEARKESINLEIENLALDVENYCLKKDIEKLKKEHNEKGEA